MCINEDIPEKSLMLDASGHYGEGRSADVLDGYQETISIGAYLDYWDVNEKLTTFELVLSDSDEKKIKDAIDRIEGRSFMTCASMASGILNENYSPEVDRCITPKGLLYSLTKYAKKHSDIVIVNQYDLKTNQEIKNEEK